MSIPSEIYDLLDDATSTPVSPFVRPNGVDFPAVVYEFDSETYEGSRYGFAGVARTEVTANALARSLEEAETIGQELVAHLAVQDCVRVTGLAREYHASYDGERPGIFVVAVSFIRFKG
tara:strand:+ start:618 stop:974 length:357 start_codon:yes stop_codon:yes gene_type:complete